MGLKACDQCSEMVDEAKAFCPACGNPFVEEEKRQEASKFDRMDNTVQLGQTMYNMMLSDMGLNISKPPNAVEKRVEVLAPVTATAAAKPSENKTETPKTASITKWLIVGGVLLIFAFLVVFGAAIILYWTRFR